MEHPDPPRVASFDTHAVDTGAPESAEVYRLATPAGAVRRVFAAPDPLTSGRSGMEPR